MPKRPGSGVVQYFRGGTLPSEAKYIEIATRKARDRIVELLVQKHGQLALYHEAVLQSAIRHEVRVQLLQRWMRTEEGLKLEQRMTLLAQISQATDSRDKCLERLGLDKLAQDGVGGVDFDGFYKRPPVRMTDAEETTEAKETAVAEGVEESAAAPAPPSFPPADEVKPAEGNVVDDPPLVAEINDLAPGEYP